jgi:hypothetical protein
MASIRPESGSFRSTIDCKIIATAKMPSRP